MLLIQKREEFAEDAFVIKPILTTVLRKKLKAKQPPAALHK